MEMLSSVQNYIASVLRGDRALMTQGLAMPSPEFKSVDSVPLEDNLITANPQ